jgi:tetratricopeptide (TPR) repeat protein
MSSSSNGVAPATLDGLTLVCLLNAGRSEEAKRLCKTRVKATGAEELRYYLGLAHAQEGEVDEAVRVLADVVERHPEHPDARKALAGLLHKQAVQRINAKDWGAAGAALGEALRLNSSDPEIQALVTSVENVMPVAYMKANRRTDAAEAWERVQRESPDKGIATHSLSLLYAFWAADAERNGRTDEADELWRQAIANCVMLSCNDSFWFRWLEERRRVYAIPEEAASELRKAWNDELRSRFRRLIADYGAADQRDNVERCEALEAELWREQTTAAALHELRLVPCPSCRRMTYVVNLDGNGPICAHANCGKPASGLRAAHSLPACGPLMLEHLGLIEEAERLASDGAGLPNGADLTGPLVSLKAPIARNNAEVLRRCMSPLHDIFSLLMRHEYEEAIRRLEEVAGGSGKKRGGRRRKDRGQAPPEASGDA